MLFTTGERGRRRSKKPHRKPDGKERLAGWAFCRAVLSAAWDFKESSELSGTIRLARMMERLV